jgi:tetratricopeptide (TPR) repeat protein
MEKDRDRRYGSPSELAEDLKRHLSHEPVVASPPSTAYRVRKFVRRHRVGVFASCLIAMALACGAVGLTVGMVKARNSAEAASDAAQQAQAVNDFMGEILTSVKPELDGADVRLFEVMDKASNTASQRFANHPLLEAQVRDLLGGVYSDLSMAGRAKVEFQRAMDVWQAHFGPDDPRTLTSERRYIGSAINNEQITEIESRLPALIERMQRNFGPDDPSTLDVRRSMAIATMLRGRTDEAEKMLLELRARIRANHDDDSQQISILRNLIRVNRIRAYGADYNIRAELAAQIDSMARELVDRAIRAHGSASLIALDARIKLAENLAGQHEYDAAMQLSREVLEIASDRLGTCHHLRLQAFNVLADASHRAGESTVAADLMLAIITCHRQAGRTMALVGTIHDSLPVFDRGDRWVEGESLAREYVENLVAMGGGHGDMTFDGEVWIVRFISLQGRLDEAEAMFQSLILRAETADLIASIRSRLHLFHGSNLRRLGSFDESELEIHRAADLMDDFRMGTRNITPDDILLEFISLYSIWGKPELADEYERMRKETLANLPMDPS